MGMIAPFDRPLRFRTLDTVTAPRRQLTDQFAGPVAPDVLVEASGGVVRSGGVTVLSFAGPRLGAIRCYDDRLALLEQTLGLSGPPERGGVA